MARQERTTLRNGQLIASVCFDIPTTTELRPKSPEERLNADSLNCTMQWITLVARLVVVSLQKLQVKRWSQSLSLAPSSVTEAGV